MNEKNTNITDQKNVLIYIRCLNKSFTNHPIQIDNRESSIDELCISRKYNVISTNYVQDNSLDYKLFKTHAHYLMNMINNTTDIDIVIIPDLSHLLGIGTIEVLADFLSFLQKNNIALISIREDIDTTMQTEYNLLKLTKLFSRIERKNLNLQLQSFNLIN